MTTNHTTLLALICSKEAQEGDEQTLREIDCRIAALIGAYDWFVSKHECFSVQPKDGHSFYYPRYQAYLGYSQETGKKLKMPSHPYGSDLANLIGAPYYATSIDAQQGLLPEGWRWDTIECWESSVSGEKFWNSILRKIGWGRRATMQAEEHKTEPLARLDAIIQAWAYEKEEALCSAIEDAGK